MCAVAIAMFATACNGEKKPIDVDDIVEDGVYVMGEATGFDKLSDLLRMAPGINEAKEQSVRDGMFEKYIVLEGGKEFSLVWVNGGEQTLYGASLAEFTPTDFSTIYADNPATAIQKGALVTGESAPKMKVAATGLYHIVLDLNKTGDLDNAQILVAPANWGVRGGMNSWGFTEMEHTAFSNDGITYKIENAELVTGLEFKFAYGGAWKITLDNEGAVKANTNIGVDSKPGGDNFKQETPGLYNITLTYKLAAGDVAKSFSYKIELGQEVEITAPEHMYMNGGQWGGENWDWNAETIVELSGIPSAPGYFWCTRWFEAAKGFKFCAVREWNGDFTGDGTVGYTVKDGNCWVEEDGFYTVFVNGNDKVVEIYPAEVYGIGDAWGADAWDFNGANVVKFEADGQVLKATTTANSSAVRLSSKIVPSAPIDGITTPNGWIDWWKTEFVYFDGKIAYRGAGGDQDRVAVSAGQVITIDFNAGTVTVEDAVPAAATIDGDMSEWADVPAFEGINNRIVEWKVTNDAKNLYFYFKMTASKIKTDSEAFDWSPYIYIGIDTDNNSGTGAAGGGGTMEGCEAQVCTFPWRGPSNVAPEWVKGADNNGWVKCPISGESLANPVVAGYIDGEWGYLEVSVPMDKLGNPTGTVAADCSMDWYVTGRKEITLK